MISNIDMAGHSVCDRCCCTRAKVLLAGSTDEMMYKSEMQSGYYLGMLLSSSAALSSEDFLNASGFWSSSATVHMRELFSIRLLVFFRGN